MTYEHAIEIYARACHAWFKSHAVSRAEEMVQRCSKSGDVEGVWWWERVKFALITMQAKTSAARNDLEELT